MLMIGATAVFVELQDAFNTSFSRYFSKCCLMHRSSGRLCGSGAAFTALLFNVGKFLIGLYLGRSRLGTYFGTAGSLLILLAWIYYASQIVFFGAEFTRVYADTYGSKIKPAKYARRTTQEERGEEGLEPSKEKRHGP